MRRISESAEDRWGRRQIEQENKKKREKKKEDTDKIKRFVERAEEKDPRVIKKRMEDKEAREAKKKAKGAGKREAEEAAKKAAEEEAAKGAAAAEDAKAAKANAKKELEKQKKALRKEKARLREQSARADGWVGHPGEDDVEELATPSTSNDATRSRRSATRLEANENEDAIVAVLTRELAKLEGDEERGARPRLTSREASRGGNQGGTKVRSLGRRGRDQAARQGVQPEVPHGHEGPVGARRRVRVRTRRESEPRRRL